MLYNILVTRIRAEVYACRKKCLRQSESQAKGMSCGHQCSTAVGRCSVNRGA